MATTETPTSIVVCKGCGADLENYAYGEEIRFCPYCGRKLADDYPDLACKNCDRVYLGGLFRDLSEYRCCASCGAALTLKGTFSR